jgi:acetolactate synthase regulatory subunit
VRKGEDEVFARRERRVEARRGICVCRMEMSKSVSSSIRRAVEWGVDRNLR